MATTNSSDNEVIVAIVPFPDYSHVNQLFILARFIASGNIPVHFLSLADQNQDLKIRIQGCLGASNIHFEDLMRPSDDDNAAGHDPILMFLKKLMEPIHKTCIELSTNAKRLVIIHEFIMTELIWNVHTFPNVKSYIFHAGSAFNRYYYLQQSIPDIVDDDHEKLVEQMHDEFPLLELDGKLMVIMEHELKFYSGEVIKSCKEVEETRFMNELALGLEQNNHSFIWVLRKGEVMGNLTEKVGKIELLEGFEERVEGRGMVVNWAPQLEILRHSSTGGFLSHCGWSSCIESISMGVPLATWPINYDQPSNAVYVTNVLKIGTSVRSWTRREELVTASTIEKAVRTLMGMTEGEQMRQRALELSKKIKSSVSHGGPARKEMESFISNIIK
ncbi:hypothetical protein P3L10_025204 [Capsicum annuum]